MAFAVAFLGESYPVPDTSFLRVDDTHYVLDVGATVTPNYERLKEVALFLIGPQSLPNPSFALGLYISVGGQEWQYRGYVGKDHPSEVMPLQWPIVGQITIGPGTIQLGVSLEPLEELKQKEGSKLAGKQEYAKRVAMDLYHFLESFNVGKASDKLVLPTNCLEAWFNKFDSKFKKDPNFLMHAGEKS